MDKLIVFWNNYNISEAIKLLKSGNNKLNTTITNSLGSDINDIVTNSPKSIKITLNENLYQITIKYQPKTFFWVFTLQCNPNKIHRFLNDIKTPTDLLTLSEYNFVTNYIETELLNLGFDLELKNSKIARYDFCGDIQTNYVYKEYLPILSQLTPPPKHRQNKGRFESSIYFKSKSSAITIYDKKTEWNLKQKENPIDYDLVRFEFKQTKISIPYNEFNFVETSQKAYNRLVELLNLTIESDDILSYMITSLNSTDKTINRLVTDLQKKLFVWFLKSELPKRDLTIDDLFIRELNLSEKVFKSKLKRWVISSDIYDNNLKELHQELQTKLKARFEL